MVTLKPILAFPNCATEFAVLLPHLVSLYSPMYLLTLGNLCTSGGNEQTVKGVSWEVRREGLAGYLATAIDNRS